MEAHNRIGQFGVVEAVGIERRELINGGAERRMSLSLRPIDHHSRTPQHMFASYRVAPPLARSFCSALATLGHPESPANKRKLERQPSQCDRSEAARRHVRNGLALGAGVECHLHVGGEHGD